MIYVVELRPEPGIDGVRALRALLKLGLRRFGLRCVRVEELSALPPKNAGSRNSSQESADFGEMVRMLPRTHQ